MYPNAQPQMMSHQGPMQNMMPTMMVMQPCDESWNETGRTDELDAIPVLEAQALSPNSKSVDESFPGAGDALSSMPPMPAGEISGLACKEPPPPPPGVPTVPSMSQAP